MRALVIDDSRAMRTILTRMMENLDFEVEAVADGRQAVDAVERGPLPDVCLIDWNMPVMNGLEFIVEIRKNRAWRDITLMMVTTEAEQANIVRALAAGAHEYVIKPFTPEVIEDKLTMLGLL
ncbi:response regulator [Mobilicoccus pelagius]|uniref:Chemotaxis protein CheY n=1 Tax=Mobilicoccus pelagius NBRC 104925 TaxID=1089455 RepID=H5UP62_9MICO|nr:response regulator [Mobilicoccus pelagius]GAB47520.1 chemotaxis protein CheY [Mobilicoccus pelagius NBRC 104925]